MPTAGALHSAASQHTRVAAISEPECTLSTGGLPHKETDEGIYHNKMTNKMEPPPSTTAAGTVWMPVPRSAPPRSALPNPRTRCPAQPTDALPRPTRSRCGGGGPRSYALWLQLWWLQRLLRGSGGRWGDRSGCNCG